jgi:hypothetical protein
MIAGAGWFYMLLVAPSLNSTVTAAQPYMIDIDSRLLFPFPLLLDISMKSDFSSSQSRKVRYDHDEFLDRGSTFFSRVPMEESKDYSALADAIRSS